VAVNRKRAKRRDKRATAFFMGYSVVIRVGRHVGPAGAFEWSSG
jgi:hypothetical protein